MANIRSVTVALNVLRPFVARRIGVAGTNVSSLQSFELLCGAEFICLL
jgi:hypothetical protein